MFSGLSQVHLPMHEVSCPGDSFSWGPHILPLWPLGPAQY
jgi:hypothetical protein